MYQYDRQLSDYLPEIVRDIREFQAVINAEQPEIAMLWQAANDALSDMLIADATANGISRWERILHISPKATATLEERRFTVLTRLNERLPFTITTLNNQLKALCGEHNYLIQLDHLNYVLAVQLSLVVKDNYDSVANLLQRIVPANLVINLSIKYNQHQTLSPYTHRYLKQFTHCQLRNEVLY